MKKLTVIISTLILTFALTTVISLAASVNVVIDGNPVQFTGDVGQPFLDENSRVQVPLRAAMEAYGCKVDWNNETKTAIVEKDGVKVEATIGQSYILKNGQQIQNDTAATMKGGKTYLPIRVVLESFGTKVDWDGKISSVVVKSNFENRVASNYEEFLNNFDITYEHITEKDSVQMRYKHSDNLDELYNYLRSINRKSFEAYTVKLLNDSYEGANLSADVVFYVNKIAPGNILLIIHKGMDVSTTFENAKIEWMPKDGYDW